jgi:hypothetical protein
MLGKEQAESGEMGAETCGLVAIDCPANRQDGGADFCCRIPDVERSQLMRSKWSSEESRHTDLTYLGGTLLPIRSIHNLPFRKQQQTATKELPCNSEVPVPQMGNPAVCFSPARNIGRVCLVPALVPCLSPLGMSLSLYTKV